MASVANSGGVRRTRAQFDGSGVPVMVDQEKGEVRPVERHRTVLSRKRARECADRCAEVFLKQVS